MGTEDGDITNKCSPFVGAAPGCKAASLPDDSFLMDTSVDTAVATFSTAAAADDDANEGFAAEGLQDAYSLESLQKWVETVEQQPWQLVTSEQQQQQQWKALLLTVQLFDRLVTARANSTKQLTSLASLLRFASGACVAAATATVPNGAATAGKSRKQDSPLTPQQMWALVDTEGSRVLQTLKHKVLRLSAEESASRRRLRRQRKRAVRRMRTEQQSNGAGKPTCDASLAAVDVATADPDTVEIWADVGTAADAAAGTRKSEQHKSTPSHTVEDPEVAGFFWLLRRSSKKAANKNTSQGEGRRSKKQQCGKIATETTAAVVATPNNADKTLKSNAVDASSSSDSGKSDSAEMRDGRQRRAYDSSDCSNKTSGTAGLRRKSNELGSSDASFFSDECVSQVDTAFQLSREKTKKTATVTSKAAGETAVARGSGQDTTGRLAEVEDEESTEERERSETDNSGDCVAAAAGKGGSQRKYERFFSLEDMQQPAVSESLDQASTVEGEHDHRENTDDGDIGDDLFFSMEDMQRFALEGEEQALKRASGGAARRGLQRAEKKQAAAESLRSAKDVYVTSGDEDEEDEEMRELLYESGDFSGDDIRYLKYDAFFDVPDVAGKTSKRRRIEVQRRKLEKAITCGKQSRKSEGFEEEGEISDGGIPSNSGTMDAEEKRLQHELERLEKQLRNKQGERKNKSSSAGESAQHLQQVKEGEEGGDTTATDSGCATDGEDEDEESVSLSESENNFKQDVKKAHNTSTKKQNEQVTPISKLLAKSEALHDEVDKLEAALVAKKDWCLQGEVWGKQRPRNALLDLDQLDLPTLASSAANKSIASADGEIKHLAVSKEEDTQMIEGNGISQNCSSRERAGLSKLSEFIERLVLQRIQENLFDDVVRRAIHPPNRDLKRETPEAELDVEKSKMGLGDLYAAEFQRQMSSVSGQVAGALGGFVNVAAMTEEERQKAELLEVFGKLMYKLDCLSNVSFRPAPPAATKRNVAAQQEGVAAVCVEEAVPLLLSNATRKAPEEIRKAVKEKQVEEMTQEERRSLRRAKKDRRRKRVVKLLKSGTLTVEGVKERAAKIAAKNKKQKEDKYSKQQTGLTRSSALAELRKTQKRVKVQELLSDALKAASREQQSKRKVV